MKRSVVRPSGGYGLLLAGNGVSAFGNSLFLVGLMIYFSSRFVSPLVLGIAQAAAFIPMLLLSYPAGVLADQRSRPHILAGSDILRGTALCLSAWFLPRAEAFAGTAGALLLILLVLIMGSMQALFQPAVVSLVTDMPLRDGEPHRDRLALRTAVNHLASLAGQGLGGLALMLLGFPALLFLNGCGFILSGFSELLIREPRDSTPPPREIPRWPGPGEILRELAVLNSRGAGIDLFILNQFMLPLFMVSFPFYIQYRLKLAQSYVGYLFALVLAGSILASLIRGRVHGSRNLSLRREGPRRVYLFGLLTGLIALGASLLSADTVIWMLFIGALVLGFAVASVYLHTVAVVQLFGASHTRGRRQGILEASSGILTPLAYLAGGAAVELLPLRSSLVFLVSGLVLVIFSLFRISAGIKNRAGF
ncbi:MFS transporter [Marispirochaeta aestuarii]|uniref:MFS transporter n=1 Tax=Marispirochaeta aestuarii TaxID=1963862 RepID=UPI002ABD3532|nr:MFS transporter [Marispirochaeta aestuarii]